MPRCSMIVAVARNRVIGVDNMMPWHIPADLRYFKSKTLGKPVIMGRRTLESIGGPLPDRFNIVVSSRLSGSPGLIVKSCLDEALEVARAEAVNCGADEIMIVGGAQIYLQLIERTDRLYLTEIDLAPEGHAHFPDYTAFGDWSETSRLHHPAAQGLPAFDYVIKDRIRATGDRSGPGQHR